MNNEHKPKMKFKVIDGQIYSPADDLLNPEAIEEMLDHYFVQMEVLSEIKKFLDGELAYHEQMLKLDKLDNIKTDTAFRSGIISQTRVILNFMNNRAR